MKKIFAYRMAFIVALLILLLAACGEKSQEDVVAKLEENMEELTGYKASAEMTMNTGQAEQKFKIDVWYKDEGLYRVALQNSNDDKGSQIILKNGDGVFVLTPALDKSFKFQTEWPDNSSQPYLYQSLVKDVLKDAEAGFESNETHYIFKTKTNYQSNNNLPFQEVHFDKASYTPSLVKVLDKDSNALVEVKFSTFDMGASFADDDFTMEKNMASSAEATSVQASVMGDLEVFYPLYTAGAEFAEQRDVELDDGKRIIITYEGEKSFTLIEERKNSETTLSAPKEVQGDIVNLGFAVAGHSKNTMEWSYGGVDFTLASDELTREEMVEIAQSVQGQGVK